MLDKTIDSALHQLHRQAINGRQDGLAHILALMRLRGLEPVAKRPSPVGGARRRDTRAVVLRALRDGAQTNAEIATILLQQRPDLTRKQAHQRVYMVRRRLGL